MGALQRQIDELKALSLPASQEEGRAFLLVCLYEKMGRHDLATRNLCDAWKAGCCDSVLLDILRESLCHSRMWREAVEAFEFRPHGRSDAFTFLLYAMLRGHLLGRLGRWQEALDCYGNLALDMSIQEQVVNQALPMEKRLAFLRRLLLKAVHEDGYLRSVGYDPFAGEDSERSVADIARMMPECRGLLAYLLRGTLLSERQVYPLLQAYMALPESKAESGRPQLSTSMSDVLMKMVRCPEVLTGREKELLQQASLRDDLEPEMVLALVEALPGLKHDRALDRLGVRLVNLPFYQVKAEVLERLVRLKPAALPRNELFEAVLAELIVRGDAKALKVLAILTHAGHPMAADVSAMVRKRCLAMDPATDAALVFRTEPMNTRCLKRVALTRGSLPDWKTIRELLTEQERKELLQAYEKALITAKERQVISGYVQKEQLQKLKALSAAED